MAGLYVMITGDGRAVVLTDLERDDEGHAILCQAESDAKVRTIKSTVRFTYNRSATLARRPEKGELKRAIESG